PTELVEDSLRRVKRSDDLPAPLQPTPHLRRGIATARRSLDLVEEANGAGDLFPLPARFEQLFDPCPFLGPPPRFLLVANLLQSPASARLLHLDLVPGDRPCRRLDSDHDLAKLFFQRFASRVGPGARRAQPLET